MNILVVGTGMYVCGRGTEDSGTILPAIYEWRRAGGTGEVHIAGAHRSGLGGLRRAVARLDRLYGNKLRPECYPRAAAHDPSAFLEAIKRIPRPACAIVAVPDRLHARVASAAIKAGLHTLVVKPLAPTVKEARALVRLQEETGVHCAVEFHKRLDRANLLLRDVLASGRIGSPLYFLVEYSQRKSIPFKAFRRWAETTNIFQYLGVHYVDIVHFATGALPERAMATAQKGWLASRGIRTPDAVQAVVEWRLPSGEHFVSSLLTNWVDPEGSSSMSDQKIKVIGTKGRVESDQKRRGAYILTDERGIEEPNPDFCRLYGSGPGEASYRGYGIESVLQFFRDAESVAAGTQDPADLEGRRPTFKAALVSTAVVEAVNRSLAAGGAWIDMRRQLGR